MAEALAELPPETAETADAGRSLVRFPCTGRPIVRLLERPSFKCWMAMVVDFSERGLGLLFHRHLEPGTVLAIELKGRRHGVSRILSVRVVHATAQADGNWLIGCELNMSLTEDEIQSLRQGPTSY